MDFKTTELIVTGIITGITLITGFVINIQKNKSIAKKETENQKVESDKILNKLSEIDTVQNFNISEIKQRLDNLEISVKRVLDLHKNTEEIPNLKDEITKVIEVFASDKIKVKNLLKSIQFDTEILFENLLLSDFLNLNETEIYEKLKTISYKHSAKKNEEIETIIKLFCSDLCQISKKYDNGKRIEKFIILCKDLFTDVSKVLIHCNLE